MRFVLMGFAGFLALLTTLCAVNGDYARDDPGLSETDGVRFSGRFLALSDADMTGTAYADGKLEPIDDQDTLTLFAQGEIMATVPASNSVISWPQVVDVSPDGLFAFVAETRGPAPSGVASYKDVHKDFPAGSKLTSFSISDARLSVLETIADVGLNPGSVDYADKTGLLVSATETKNSEVFVAGLRWDGTVREVRKLRLNIDYLPNETERYIRTVHVSPDGQTLAANIANRRVQFFTLDLDESGLPVRARPLGKPTSQIGRRLSVGKWAPNGKYFIITDTGWSDNTLAMLMQGPGKLTVLAPPESKDSTPLIIGKASVGLSPEGFGMSRDGTKLATIDMGRTYLPEIAPLTFWPARRQYSVTLLSFDPETGALNTLDQVHQSGILPEDVIFDDNGENLAVAVFHRRKGMDRNRGFIDFFSIENDKIVSQKVTRPVVRGVHDLVPIPQ